jgi:hypothetical protein
MLKTLSASLMATLLAGGLPASGQDAAFPPVKIVRVVPNEKGEERFTALRQVTPIQDGMEITDRYAGLPVYYKVEVPPGLQIQVNLAGENAVKLRVLARDRFARVGEGLTRNLGVSAARQVCYYENRTGKPAKFYVTVVHHLEAMGPRPTAYSIGGALQSFSFPEDGMPFVLRFTGAPLEANKQE